MFLILAVFYLFLFIIRIARHSSFVKEVSVYERGISINHKDENHYYSYMEISNVKAFMDRKEINTIQISTNWNNTFSLYIENINEFYNLIPPLKRL